MDQPEELERLTNKIVCPHCKGDVQLVTRVRITQVSDTVAIPPGCIAPSPEQRLFTRRDSWLASLTPTQRGIIQEAQDNGLLAALRTAMDYIPAASRPKLVEPFLLTTLSVATPIAPNGEIPRLLLLRLRNIYDTGRLAVYKAHSVLIVVVDDRLRGFLPTSVLNEARPSRFHTQDPEDASWFKTRWGYVPGNGLLFEELRHRYLGGFDRISKT